MSYFHCQPAFWVLWGIWESTCRWAQHCYPVNKDKRNAYNNNIINYSSLQKYQYSKIRMKIPKALHLDSCNQSLSYLHRYIMWFMHICVSVKHISISFCVVPLSFTLQSFKGWYNLQLNAYSPAINLLPLEWQFKKIKRDQPNEFLCVHIKCTFIFQRLYSRYRGHLFNPRKWHGFFKCAHMYILPFKSGMSAREINEVFLCRSWHLNNYT